MRKMRESDLELVSLLGFNSKQSWGYDRSQMATFERELTLTPDHLSQLFAAEVLCMDKQIVGYFTISQHPDGVTELEHLFVAPDRFHKGIGTCLLKRAVEVTRLSGKGVLTIIADPYSAGFYERFGAIKVGDHESSIPERTIPVYELWCGSGP